MSVFIWICLIAMKSLRYWLRESRSLPNGQYSVRAGSRDNRLPYIITINIIFFSCVIAVVIIVWKFGLFSIAVSMTNKDVYNRSANRWNYIFWGCSKMTVKFIRHLANCRWPMLVKKLKAKSVIYHGVNCRKSHASAGLRDTVCWTWCQMMRQRWRSVLHTTH